MLAFALLAAATLFGRPEACAPGSGASAAEVTVDGFRDRKGQLRIAVYPATEADFLAPARYVTRLDTPMTPAGAMAVCAPVPAPGDYVVVALHDRDANGRLGPFRDGAGFSRNPRLGLAKPAVEAVRIRIDGRTPLAIRLNYLQGLRVAPIADPAAGPGPRTR